jgi:hypothetical protein
MMFRINFFANRRARKMLAKIATPTACEHKKARLVSMEDCDELLIVHSKKRGGKTAYCPDCKQVAWEES